MLEAFFYYLVRNYLQPYKYNIKTNKEKYLKESDTCTCRKTKYSRPCHTLIIII